MNLLYANPLTLAFHYLTLFFYGTPYEDLQNQFYTGDRQNFANIPHEDLAFDFIVVGGGSAGSVVAARLSEENYNVLLLEVGGNPFPLTSVAAFPFINMNHPNIDWKDTIQPQSRACHLFRNNAGIINRGKVLGGGSIINYLIYMRGNAEDYDRWARETGDDGWSFQNMLPYLKKLENYDGVWQDDKVHGTSGPLHISKASYAPFREEWLEVGKDLGYKISDPNGHQTESFFPYEFTIKKGTRTSTHQAYLYPALTRPNLTIRPYSTVTKVQLNAQNEAVGVEYENGGKTYSVRATKEIILSSGSIGSPKLLMLSGIGPRDHLESLGIPTKIDLPAVGQNLQDHQMTWIGPILFDQTKLKVPVVPISEAALHEYILNGTGPFSGGGVGGGALFRTSVSPGWPDLFMSTLVTPLDTSTTDLLQSTLDVKEGVLHKYFEKDNDKVGLFVVISLGLPKTRGEIKLTSKDPVAPLHLDPNYFDLPDDATAMIEGVKFVVDLVKKSDTLKSLGAKLTTSLLPGCEHHGNSESEEYWKCYLKHWTSTMFHYSCTNRMGKSRENSVVDSALRVWGTKRLRIADASVMPFVTNANTNIPTIAIGERASDLIKQTWSCAEASNQI